MMTEHDNSPPFTPYHQFRRHFPLLALLLALLMSTPAVASTFMLEGKPIALGERLFYKNPYDAVPPRVLRIAEFANDGMWGEWLDYDARRDATKRIYLSPYNLSWLSRSGTVEANAAVVQPAAAPSKPPSTAAPANRTSAIAYLVGTWDLSVAGADKVTDGRYVYDHIYGAGTGAVTINADGTYSWGFNYGAPAIKGRWRPCEPNENYVEGQGIRLLAAERGKDITIIKVPDSRNPTKPHRDMVYSTPGNGYYEHGYRR
jgi:hypothetical protein